MEVIKVQEQKQSYKVTTENKQEYVIPYIKGTFLYKETKEYLDSGGMIEPEFTQDDLDKQAESEAKTQKEKELNALQVSLNNVSYDAHMEAMGNMGIVTAIASFEMWKAWASLSHENLAVYNAVFKQTIEWKGATNEKHVVQIESVAETAKKAMEAKAEILFKC